MKNNYKVKGFVIALSIVVVIIVAAIIVVFVKVDQHPINKRMFSDISAFSKLDEIAEMVDISNDKGLNDLTPKESYMALVNYNNHKFMVRAYIFNSDEDAFEYYKTATGNVNSIKTKCLYFQRSDLFGTEYFAFHENCAMSISGKNYVSLSTFVNWLTEDFPVDIGEVFYEENGFQLP